MKDVKAAARLVRLWEDVNKACEELGVLDVCESYIQVTAERFLEMFGPGEYKEETSSEILRAGKPVTFYKSEFMGVKFCANEVKED